MDRVVLTPEAVREARELLTADSLDGVRNKVLRIAVGSCGLRRPVAAPAPAEPQDERLVVDGLPVAIAPTLQGVFRVTVGRGRFGAWLNVEHEQPGD